MPPSVYLCGRAARIRALLRYAIQLMKDLSKERLFAVLAGLMVLSCDKSAAKAEPEPVAAQPAAVPAKVEAKEVPKDAGASGASGKENTCAPGGCAPGKCGGQE